MEFIILDRIPWLTLQMHYKFFVTCIQNNLKIRTIKIEWNETKIQ